MSGRRDLPPLLPTPQIRTPDEVDPLTGELLYPGHGYPSDRREKNAGATAWGRLRSGQPLGKTVYFVYDGHGAPVQKAQGSILQINGDDSDAQQITLTLNSPRVAPHAFSRTLAQNATRVQGFQDNVEILSRGNFPGDTSPLAWPPFYAYVQWGVGGAQAQALVDFVNGATINLVASFLRVDAFAFLDRNDTLGTGAVYALSAFAGPGWTRPGIAQHTLSVGAVDPRAESDVFPVPRFAKNATVVSCDASAAPSIPVTVATLRFWQSAGGQADGNSAGNFVAAGNQPVPFDVPAAGAYVSVASGMGATAKFKVVFNLAI